MTAERGPESPPPTRRRRSRRRREPGSGLTSLAQAVEVLDRAVSLSPADETEILWWEVRRSRVGHPPDDFDSIRRVERSAMIRVREGGRTGNFRIDRPTTGALNSGIRQAMAHARGAEPTPRPPLPDAREPEPEPPPFDHRLASLSPQEAHRTLERSLGDDEAAILEWSEGRVVIQNSRGLRRAAKVTSATCQVRSGEETLAGFSGQSARHLEELDLDKALARARRRRAESRGDAPGSDAPIHLVLSPEATIELVNQLNVQALGARAYREGTSFLRQHAGVQVFDREFDLIDDATDAGGMPFPFDLEGRTKRPVELISRGVPRSPTLDSESAIGLGMRPTGHGLGGGEAFGLHLFMRAGELSEPELIEKTESGLWVGRLERLEVFDPSRMLFRAHCRGVRTITGGQIRHAVPEQIWEDSLLRVFSNFFAIGRNAAVKASRDGFLGSTSAPATAIAEVAGLRSA